MGPLRFAWVPAWAPWVLAGFLLEAIGFAWALAGALLGSERLRWDRLGLLGFRLGLGLGPCNLYKWRLGLLAQPSLGQRFFENVCLALNVRLEFKLGPMAWSKPRLQNPPLSWSLRCGT